MSPQEEINTYHSLAKAAGNRLRAYILSVASGATAVFFFTITQSAPGTLAPPEKSLLGSALLLYLATVALCLIELRVDAKRFFALAKELEKPEAEQCWKRNEKYKTIRYWLIHASYLTLGLAVVLTGGYLALRIAGS